MLNNTENHSTVLYRSGNLPRKISQLRDSLGASLNEYSPLFAVFPFISATTVSFSKLPDSAACCLESSSYIRIEGPYSGQNAYLRERLANQKFNGFLHVLF